MMPLFNNSKTIGASAAWVPIGANGSLIIVGGTVEDADDRVTPPHLPYYANATNSVISDLDTTKMAIHRHRMSAHRQAIWYNKL